MAEWRTRLAEADREAERLNSEADWDEFDPESYVVQNYLELQSDDRKIVQLIRDFFAANDDGDDSRVGVDVGSGANLYPAMAMLPFCGRVELREYGRRNLAWLRKQLRFGYSAMWDQYWEIFSANPAYHRIDDARETLTTRARAYRQNIFELPENKYDMGTMSFVAESLTTQRVEFNAAIQRFVGSLRPGAPFAAAFMRDSSGYYVGTVRFPAIPIREADVEQCLQPLADDLVVTTVRSDAVRREGYHNMIVATGRARRRPI